MTRGDTLGVDVGGEDMAIPAQRVTPRARAWPEGHWLGHSLVTGSAAALMEEGFHGAGEESGGRELQSPSPGSWANNSYWVRRT